MKKALFAVAALLIAGSVSQAGFFHRGGGCGGGGHLFHRGGGCCSGASQGCSGASQGCGCTGGCGCTATANCGCGGGMTAVPCSNCPGGVRYVSSEYGNGIAVAQQFAVPDGQGGYRIVQSSGVYNGLPIVNATAENVPAPRSMPK